MDFDSALTNVLRSTVEMEKIQRLSEEEFQRVIDVLGQVGWFSNSLFSFLRLLTPYLPVLWNRGCYERRPEEMLQITV
jgi:hypothetical protein